MAVAAVRTLQLCCSLYYIYSSDSFPWLLALPPQLTQTVNNIPDFLTDYLALDSADQEREFPTKTHPAPPEAGPNAPPIPNDAQPPHRGTDQDYSNANFTILQAIINVKTGNGLGNPDHYETYVQDNVFKPAGVDISIFNTVPSANTIPQGTPAASIGALWYSDAYDQLPGCDLPQNWMVAAAGFLANVKQMGILMNALRGDAVLSDEQEALMFTNELGWDRNEGRYGDYYSHGGAFGSVSTAYGPSQGIRSAFVRLTDGYDCALVFNSDLEQTFGDVAAVDVVIAAFETRVV
jgi:CubicO group peptidase (beta-lactamase class C family)